MVNSIAPRALLLTFTAVVSLASCRFGTNPKNVDWVNSPSGARVALRVKDEPADRVGELLAADDDGVLLRGTSLVRVAWDRVYAIDVDQLSGNYDVMRGQKIMFETKRRLMLVSRFPQGVSPELMTQLLALNKQSQLERIK